MARRDFRTPSTLPESTLTRCITIPASQEWLGLVNAALLMLTEEWRYIQVEETDMSAAATAARAFEMYVAYLGECTMDCADVLACMLPYMQAQQIAGGTVRLDPVSELPQVSYDGGTTWTDIPESAQPVQTPAPTVTPGSDDTERVCLASTRAALVIAQFYEQTFGAFAADLLNTLNSINQFLHSINTALYNLVYSPYEGVLEAAGWFDFDFTTNYTAGTLTTEQVEDITCLLIDNATVADGIVDYDHATVQAALIGLLGVNPGTAVTLLVSTMRSEGLQSASLVNVVSSADCAYCIETEWCYTFDFLTDAYGFTSVLVKNTDGSDYCGAGNTATWISGTGLRVSGARGEIGMSFTRSHITYVSATAVVSGSGGATGRFGLFLFDPDGGAAFDRDYQVYVDETNAAGAAINIENVTDVMASEIAFYRCNDSGNTDIYSLEVHGTGENPFGTDNC